MKLLLWLALGVTGAVLKHANALYPAEQGLAIVEQPERALPSGQRFLGGDDDDDDDDDDDC
jgi:hypothetical protein